MKQLIFERKDCCFAYAGTAAGQSRTVATLDGRGTQIMSFHDISAHAVGVMLLCYVTRPSWLAVIIAFLQCSTFWVGPWSSKTTHVWVSDPSAEDAWSTIPDPKP